LELRRLASMGPPPFDGGNWASRWNLVSGTKASMGPPPFDGGNPEILRGIQRVVRALQWGHRLSTVETRFSSSGFSLWATLQWGHRLSTVETLRRMTMIWNLDALLQWGHRLSTVETGRAGGIW
jgi:hypothetical protein